MGGGIRWPNADLEAVDYPAGTIGYGPGFYAYKELDDLLRAMPPEDADTILALGSVEMWGEYVEHEAGWRAQFCRVRSLDWLIGGFMPTRDMASWRQTCLATLRHEYAAPPDPAHQAYFERRAFVVETWENHRRQILPQLGERYMAGWRMAKLPPCFFRPGAADKPIDQPIIKEVTFQIVRRGAERFVAAEGILVERLGER